MYIDLLSQEVSQSPIHKPYGGHTRANLGERYYHWSEQVLLRTIYTGSLCNCSTMGNKYTYTQAVPHRMVLLIYTAITTFIVFQMDNWRLHVFYALLIVLLPYKHTLSL